MLGYLCDCSFLFLLTYVCDCCLRCVVGLLGVAVGVVLVSSWLVVGFDLVTLVDCLDLFDFGFICLDLFVLSLALSIGGLLQDWCELVIMWFGRLVGLL